VFYNLENFSSHLDFHEAMREGEEHPRRLNEGVPNRRVIHMDEDNDLEAIVIQDELVDQVAAEAESQA
jgi:hypothetical protein